MRIVLTEEDEMFYYKIINNHSDKAKCHLPAIKSYQYDNYVMTNL